MESNEVIIDETAMTLNEDNDMELNEVVVSDDAANYRPVIGMIVR